MVVGVWAMLPPYLTPKLDVARSAKLADHVIPGILVMLLSLSRLVGIGHTEGQLGGLLTGMAALMTGFWMTATHVPLWFELGTANATLPVVANHSAPGLALLVLGFVWCVHYWSLRDPDG
jgi:hypothetical protein